VDSFLPLALPVAEISAASSQPATSTSNSRF